MDGFPHYFSISTACLAHDLADDADALFGEAPVVVAQGDRRMQMRADRHWASLSRGGTLPLIADLRLDRMGAMADHAVLLELATGRISYIGAALAAQSGIGREDVAVDRLPADSLLARAIARAGTAAQDNAPYSIAEDDTAGEGSDFLYRATWLPFATVAGGAVTHRLGIITWKECADAALSAELARLMGEALEQAEAHPAPVALPEGAALVDWLASARELAQAAALASTMGSQRPRATLYAAIGQAYDFELAARRDPGGLARLLAEAGLAAQRRNPLVPLVRLVFGKTHDKTRVAEIAAALAHGRRLGLGRGAMAPHLARVAGGLKGVVAEERRLRATEHARRRRSDPAHVRLATMPVRAMDTLATQGPEFTVLVARRMGDGTLALVGEAGGHHALLSRAAQALQA
jgi:hypothetical protein